MDFMKDDDGILGWDVINVVLVVLYFGQELMYYGMVLFYMLGGNDLLDGISVYWVDVLCLYWYYVIYGFFELYDKQSDDVVDSGYGFELIFCLVVDDDVVSLFMWLMNLLQNFVCYVFVIGNVFEVGYYMDVNGLIVLDIDICLCYVVFLFDLQLLVCDIVNGCLVFLQVIGVSDVEMVVIKCWFIDGVLYVLVLCMLLWIIDLYCFLLFDDVDLVWQVEVGSVCDGFSIVLLFVEILVWCEEGDSMVLVFGVGQVLSLLDLLLLCLCYGYLLIVIGGDCEWIFQFGECDVLCCGEGGMMCMLMLVSLDVLLCDVCVQCGCYLLFGIGLMVEVVFIVLCDVQDNVVCEIG